MAFMERDITEKQGWYMVDGTMGTEYIPDYLASYDASTFDPDDDPRIPHQLADYCENRTAWTIEHVTGYGARMSAPGYLDCTDWAVFDTPEEAEDYLTEYYGDDDEGEGA